MPSDIADLHEALTVGLSACQYLAGTLAMTGRDLEILAAASNGTPKQVGERAVARTEATLRKALIEVSRVMELLGDHANNCDAVEANDEAATAHAFERVRVVLEER